MVLLIDLYSWSGGIHIYTSYQELLCETLHRSLFLAVLIIYWNWFLRTKHYRAPSRQQSRIGDSSVQREGVRASLLCCEHPACSEANSIIRRGCSCNWSWFLDAMLKPGWELVLLSFTQLGINRQIIQLINLSPPNTFWRKAFVIFFKSASGYFKGSCPDYICFFLSLTNSCLISLNWAVELSFCCLNLQFHSRWYSIWSSILQPIWGMIISWLASEVVFPEALLCAKSSHSIDMWTS